MGTFIIPDNYQVRLYEYVVATRPDTGNDVVDQRRRLEAQAKRLRDLYFLGDIEKAQYIVERDHLKRDLALLDMRAQGQASHLDGLAELLANISTAWDTALPEQRNRLARLLFEEVIINDEQVAAVKPRPELAGFFLLDYQQRAGLSHECCTSGPDGDRIREYNTQLQSGCGRDQLPQTLPRDTPQLLSRHGVFEPDVHIPFT